MGRLGGPVGNALANQGGWSAGRTAWEDRAVSERTRPTSQSPRVCTPTMAATTPSGARRSTVGRRRKAVPAPAAQPPRAAASVALGGGAGDAGRGRLGCVSRLALGAGRPAACRHQGRRGIPYADSEPEQPIAADGWFAIIGAGAGILFALLAWLVLRKYRGIAVLIGLTLGSLVSAVLAWWVGYKIGYAQFVPIRNAAAVGDHIEAPLDLAMTNLDPKSLWKLFPTGVAAVQALLGAMVYTFLAGFSAHSDLRGRAGR